MNNVFIGVIHAKTLDNINIELHLNNYTMLRLGFFKHQSGRSHFWLEALGHTEAKQLMQ